MVLASELGASQRGASGFGSTGVRSLRLETSAASTEPGGFVRRRATSSGTHRSEGLEFSAGEEQTGPQPSAGARESEGTQIPEDGGRDRPSEDDPDDPQILWHTEWGSAFHRTQQCLRGRYRAFKVVACETCFGSGERPPSDSIRLSSHVAHSMNSGHGSRRGANRKVLFPCRICAAGSSFDE